MKNILKNFGKTIVVLISTVIQLVAWSLRFISLIFQTIGLVFHSASAALIAITSVLLNKVGYNNERKTEELIIV